jgi:hypothetical protein
MNKHLLAIRGSTDSGSGMSSSVPPVDEDLVVPLAIQRRSMAQRDNRLPILGTWHAPPRSRRYAPLSGAAKYPAGARPSKGIIIEDLVRECRNSHGLCGVMGEWEARRLAMEGLVGIYPGMYTRSFLNVVWPSSRKNRKFARR